MTNTDMALRPLLATGMIMACLFSPLSASAAPLDAQPWTLQRSIERAIAIAPEIKNAQADIRAGQGLADKADDWPNPSISLRVENNIQRQLLQSGYALDQITVSQPVPLMRIQPQREVAQQGVLAAEAGATSARLNIEARVAQLFLTLQARHDKLKLAEQRLKFTHQLVRSLKQPADTSGIVRYIKPLDRARMQLLDEAANQDTATARFSYQESLDAFRNFLYLSADAPVRLPSMAPISAPVSLPGLQQRLDSDAVQLRRLRHKAQAAEAGVGLQKALRIDDPTLTLIHERNVDINNQTFSFNGIVLSVSIPLWDQNHGGIEEARAKAIRAEGDFQIAKRELVGRMRQDHMRLQHLRLQAQRFNKSILLPARRLLRNTEEHYDVGAATSLALIDAYNTYFNASNRYIDLLFRGHQSAIDLRQTLGESLLNKHGAPK